MAKESARRVEMKAGYARVSTKDQAIDLQVDALKKTGCTKIYTEVMSGSRTERPILSKLLENLRAGDVLVIWKRGRRAVPGRHYHYRGVQEPGQ